MSDSGRALTCSTLITSLMVSSTVWQLCNYSIKDPGYTVHFKLEEPIEIDGLRSCKRSRAQR